MANLFPPGDKAVGGIPSSPYQPGTGSTGLGGTAYQPSTQVTVDNNFTYTKVKADMIRDMADVISQYGFKVANIPNGRSLDVINSAFNNTAEFKSDMGRLFDDVEYALRYGYSFSTSESYRYVVEGLAKFTNSWGQTAVFLAGGQLYGAPATNLSFHDAITLPSGVLFGYKTAYAIYDVNLNWGGGSKYSGKTDVMFINDASRPVYSGGGNDLVILNASNATAVDEAGNDTYIAVDSKSTVQFLGSRQSYKLSTSGEKTVVTNASGEQDVIYGADRLKFSDGTLAFDDDGNAGMAYRLYQAALNRKPDSTGLSFWVDQLDSGATPLSGMAKLMISSTEFQAKYGAVSNATFVSLVYENVLHRKQDATGAAFWEGQLASGQSREAVLLQFSESPENIKAVAPDINAGIWLV